MDYIFLVISTIKSTFFKPCLTPEREIANSVIFEDTKHIVADPKESMAMRYAAGKRVVFIFANSMHIVALHDVVVHEYNSRNDKRYPHDDVIKWKHFPRYWPFVRGIPAQRPVTRSFGVFFDLRLNYRSNKQSWGWWFETLSRPLWRHCNETRTEIALKATIGVTQSSQNLSFENVLARHRSTTR